jgi:hypothetical protein
MAFRIIWEFRAAEGRSADFERAYGAEGVWTELFRRSAGYLGTDLIRPEAVGGWYRTIDRWKSREDCDAFHKAFAAEYAALDAACAVLTAGERFVLIEDA